MNEKIKTEFKEIKRVVDSNKVVKTAVYIGIGVLSLYILGKAFKGLASTVFSGAMVGLTLLILSAN